MKLVEVEQPLDDSLVSGNTKVKVTDAESFRDACDACEKNGIENV